MKHLFSLILFTSILFIGDYAVAFSDKASSKNDLETQFIILEFPKYEKVKIQQLLSELHSYSGKIYDAQFDYETHQLTVSYYTTIKLDDILEVVSKYNMDFTKFSGSELE